MVGGATLIAATVGSEGLIRTANIGGGVEVDLLGYLELLVGGITTVVLLDLLLCREQLLNKASNNIRDAINKPAYLSIEEIVSTPEV